MRPEKITILNDEIMREKGFQPLSVEEKINWVTKHLNKAKDQLIELKKRRYHLDDPTTAPVKGDDSLEAKREIIIREDKLMFIDRKIYRTKLTVEEYQLWLDEYHKEQKDNGSDTRSNSAIAIEMVVNRVRYKDECRRALTRYVKFKQENNNRSARNIYKKEFDANGECEFKESIFYKWVKRYKENLDELQCAQGK